MNIYCFNRRYDEFAKTELLRNEFVELVAQLRDAGALRAILLEKWHDADDRRIDINSEITMTEAKMRELETKLLKLAGGSDVVEVTA